LSDYISRLLVVAVLAGALVANCGWAESAEPESDPHGANEADSYASQILAVADGVVLAGVVDLTSLRSVQQGPVTVVDLRTEAEGVTAAAIVAGELGLTYHNLPVAGASIDPAQLNELRNLLDGRRDDEFMVIHCASGNRAGMLWGALALEQGENLEIVRAELAPILNKTPAIDALEEFAATLEVDDGIH
jgi:protein tyrosine phosphatase (PTP) superfamily phosphohydrolase (DUF442 family)